MSAWIFRISSRMGSLAASIANLLPGERAMRAGRARGQLAGGARGPYLGRDFSSCGVMRESATAFQSGIAERYIVERELGRGGMATVYLACDRKHDRKVALKVLLPELAASLGAERFLREIQLAAGLTHPHILPLYDSGEVDGLLYYVMPFIDGESLRDRLVRERRLQTSLAIRIAREGGEALDYAHRRGGGPRD